jgi:hypothetical protein
MTTPIPCLLIFAFGILGGAPCLADNGYMQLFGAEGKTISTVDQRAIYTQLGFKLAKDRKSFIDAGCDPAGYSVELVDLNSDGTPEVWVSGGNTCTSGMTGSSVWLFVKSGTAGYRANLGFPAGGWKVLPQKSNGFPDLRFGGPGFCEAVWRWDGTTYKHFKNVATAKGGCAGR